MRLKRLDEERRGGWFYGSVEIDCDIDAGALAFAEGFETLDYFVDEFLAFDVFGALGGEDRVQAERTRDFAAGKRVNAFSGISRAARMKLDRLEAAARLKDLAALPGNRFEALAGDRKGQYSIRINDQWRICFVWQERAAGPSDVEIVDYH